MAKPRQGAAICFALAACLFGLTLPRAALAQEEEPLAALVKQLGSNKFAEREKARLHLKAIGLPALEALRAGCDTGDLETISRCQELIQKLEDKLVADALLRPLLVRMNLTEVTALEAIERLQKQSGYQISVIGDREPLTKRKFSLDIGEATFWQAFDKICEAGKLAQHSAPVLPYYYGAPKSAAGAIGQPAFQILLRPMPAKGGAMPLAPVKAGAAGQQGQGQPNPGLPVQIQVRQGPLPGQQVLIGVGQLGNPMPGQQSPILVQAGVSEKAPVSYCGDIRMRLLSAASPQFGLFPNQKGRNAFFVLELAGEPKLDQLTLVGSPLVTKAVDEHGQSLTAVTDEAVVPTFVPGASGPSTIFQHSVLALEMGPKKAKMLTELTGTVAVRALDSTPRPMIVVEDVLKVDGKTAKGHGGSITIGSVNKRADGSYEFSVIFESPPDLNPADPPGGPALPPAAQPPVKGAVAVKSTVFRPVNKGLPVLLDSEGKALLLTQIPERLVRVANGVVYNQMTMVFKAGPVVGEPAKMVLFGYRMVSAEVPFRFEGIQIPAVKP